MNGFQGATFDSQKANEELQANMTYPDQRDHKEILLTSLTSSATGQERKEVYNFSFDRVKFPHSIVIFSDIGPGVRTKINPSGSIRRNFAASSELYGWL